MIRILFFSSVGHVMKGPLNLSIDWNRNIEMLLRGRAWHGCQEDGTTEEVVLEEDKREMNGDGFLARSCPQGV